MKFLLSTTLLVSATLAFSAAYAAPQNSARALCKNDAQSFCSDVPPGSVQMNDCLEEHYQEVSDACYTALKAEADRREAGQKSSHHMPPPPEGPPPPRDGDTEGPPPPPPEDDINVGPPPGPSHDD